MRKVILFVLFVLGCTLWAVGVPHPVLIGITGVGSGPVSGTYTFEAWLEDDTSSILTESGTGCFITPTYAYIDVGNFSNAWTAGNVIHVKLWEADSPDEEQPIALQIFTLTNDNPEIFFGSEGITLYYPPLAVILTAPADEGNVVTSDIATAILDWEKDTVSGAGDNSTNFDVYLSTNLTDVNNLVALARIATDLDASTVSSYNPLLGFSKTYYWRVVSKNSTSNIDVNGTIWSFTTGDEIIEETITTGVPQDFEFGGGESGGQGVTPAVVEITASGSGDLGTISIIKYENPPASVPCPERSLGLLFDIDGSSFQEIGLFPWFLVGKTCHSVEEFPLCMCIMKIPGQMYLKMMGLKTAVLSGMQ